MRNHISTSIRLLILLTATHLFAQHLSIDFAEHLFESGKYESAITEYYRFIFFNPDSARVSYAYYKIGLAYRNESQWDKSVSALEMSIRTAPNDSIRNEREISLALVTTARGEFHLAEFQLVRIELYTPFPATRRKAAFFRGINCLYQFKWEEARRAFQVCFQESLGVSEFLHLADSIDSLTLLAQHSADKNPRLAKWLSTFLPGSGQFYAEDWPNGLNALAINSANGYLLINDIVQHHWRDALMTYLLLFERYYLGNRHHAARSAENYNRRVNEEFAERILELFEEE
ncbi:MAG: tol-pal system YbgF family protein [bacterium]